jgi:Tol biopolymer transport system component
VSADGSNTEFLAQGNSPAWSPDGARIAFGAMHCDDYYYYDDCGSNGVSVMNTDATGIVHLTSDGSDAGPGWHPDGSKLAFTRSRKVLYVINADGSALAPIPIPDNPIAVFDPAWSPDGAKIAFTCEVVSGNTDICLVNADGTRFQRLTTDPAEDARPAWKPDGSRIAFSTARYSRDHEIATMTPDGSGVTRLIAGTGAIQPAWSPDGAKIVFAAFGCDPFNYCSSSGLFVINADGTGLTRFTTGLDYAPAWRP